MHGKQPRQVSNSRFVLFCGATLLCMSWRGLARRHDVAPELRIGRGKIRWVESLSRSATTATGRGHHLILDAVASGILWLSVWLVVVVRVVGLLHDPISGAAQGLVSWSRLIGCNPWTDPRCLRSARAITFERRRCVAMVPLFPSGLEGFQKLLRASVSPHVLFLFILEGQSSCLSCFYCRLYALMPNIPVTESPPCTSGTTALG